MAAPIVAVDLESALFNVNLNIHSLHESGVNLKARLSTWRSAFFPLIDLNDVSQAFINRWSVATLAMEQELAATQTWFEVEKIIGIMNSTLASARWNGFLYLKPGLRGS